jgi:hypothetical protein
VTTVGYGGGDVAFVTDTVTCYLSGGTLVFSDVNFSEKAQQVQTHAWPPRHSAGADAGGDVDAGSSPGGGGSITAFAACPATHTVAYSCTGGVGPPVVCVARYPSLEVLAQLAPNTQLAVAHLAFSKDGARLLTVGAAPDYTATLWLGLISLAAS